MDVEEAKAPSEPKKKANTSVYVTGLPVDVTAEEIKESFERYGIIMEDLTTQPKIKLYNNAEGKFKGDARVTYFKSVELSINLLDDSSFRYGDSTNIRDRTEEDQKLSKRLDWVEGEEDAVPTKFSKLVVLKHMFTKEEIEADPTLLLDLKEEFDKNVRVTNVILYDQHTDDGVVTVRFKEVEAAEACVKRNNNRFSGGQKVIAYQSDGKEKFKKKLSKEEEQAEEEKRLAAYEDWLEKLAHYSHDL
ncbi:hypothetical protein BC829DRAFT_442165 [Chytridium lagenaria]|nr:hypothetical protein BC829DRAFT_442165 [Chytridium lagenaria]